MQTSAPCHTDRPLLVAAGAAPLPFSLLRLAAASDGDVLFLDGRERDRPGDAYEPAAMALACGVMCSRRPWRDCEGRVPAKDAGVSLETWRGVAGVPDAAAACCAAASPSADRAS